MDILCAYNPALFDSLRRCGEGVLGRFMLDSWRMIGRVLTCSRLKYRPDILRFRPVALPVADLGRDYTLSFEDTCDWRAEDVIAFCELSGQAHINLMWSGGIDSTVALVSLLKTGRRDILDRVQIVLSEHSIAEYPWFYHNFIDGAFAVIDAATTLYDRFYEDSIVVTGEFGDQIFGSDLVELVAQVTGWEAIKSADYKDTVMAYFTHCAGKEAAARFFSLYQPIVHESPIPIRNAFDFLWFWNFSQKFQSVGYRGLLYSSPENIKRNAGRIFNFFESPHFQAWSLANHAKKMTGDWLTYKNPAKKYVCQYTGDWDFMQKPKVRSLQNLNAFNNTQRILRTDFQFADNFGDYMKADFSYGI